MSILSRFHCKCLSSEKENDKYINNKEESTATIDIPVINPITSLEINQTNQSYSDIDYLPMINSTNQSYLNIDYSPITSTNLVNEKLTNSGNSLRDSYLNSSKATIDIKSRLLEIPFKTNPKRS